MNTMELDINLDNFNDFRDTLKAAKQRGDIGEFTVKVKRVYVNMITVYLNMESHQDAVLIKLLLADK